MEKSNAVAYVSYLIRTTRRSDLIAEIEDSPLTDKERDFMIDIMAGMTYEELAGKYDKSYSRIGKWKREVFQKLHRYDVKRRLPLRS